MTDQAIVAVYDTPAHAELAVQDLLQAGIPESAVRRHAQEGSYAGIASTPTTRTTEGTGFWASLFGGEPDHDVAVYDRSVQNGSTALTVHVDDAHVTQVMDILDRHNPVDIDERAGTYGLTQRAAPPLALAPAPGTATAATSVGAADPNTLHLSEESLAVGKRVINRGTTRIRRFVVETPVEEQVSLHDERVVIERNPVTDGRAVSGSDFTDRVIEMTETAEEAVVSKTAHVKEEITLRKDATDRVETVRDTLRREDVEIVRVPGDTSTVTTEPTRKPAI